MSKLPTVTGNQAIAAFTKDGWVVKRIKSSHHIMKKPGHQYLLTVPLHSGKNLKPGTLRSLIHNADMTVARFVALLDD